MSRPRTEAAIGWALAVPVVLLWRPFCWAYPALFAAYLRFCGWATRYVERRDAELAGRQR